MGSFRPLEPLRGWRRLAVQTWRAPSDPSVYALVDVPMAGALAYLERLRRETDVRLTVTHLVAKGVALAISRYPQLNGIVARGRIMLRESVDIFLQVATDGGSDLAGVKISRADRKSVVEIAQESEARVAALRAGRDRNVERTKSVLSRIPLRLLGPFMRTVSWLVYDRDLDLSRFGVVKDEFGTVMISNVGSVGVGVALGPLVPFSRTPTVVLVGEVEDRVVAENGAPVVRPMLTLGVTFDHRFMDGFQGGRMIEIFRSYMADPEAAGEKAAGPLPARADAPAALRSDR
jgi:pyruvate/2-oxoglutarate dehydrogenase complex dihydrolipoamide acyltransferase (E2) component